MIKEVREKAADIKVTAEKNYLMTKFYDDRSIQVEQDTGIRIGEKIKK